MRAGLRGGRYLIVMGIFCAGVALSYAMFSMAREGERKRIEGEFREFANERADAFERKVGGTIELLYFVHSLYAASEQVTREEFRIFVGEMLSRHPDVISFDWMPRVTDDERAKFERAGREQGIPDFGIKDSDGKGHLIAAARRPEYFPIFYSEPFGLNKFLMGFNGASDAARWEAMEKARDTAEPFATSRIRLFRAPEGGFACRVFIPVYRNDAPHATREERRENLAGFISIVFKVRGVLESALKNLAPRGIDTYVYDGTSPQPGNYLFYWEARLRVDRGAHAASVMPPSGGVRLQRGFVVAGRVWTLVAVPCPEFLDERASSQPWIVLLAGWAMTLMFCMYVTEILRRESKIRALVDERTRELANANRELALAVEIGERAQQMIGEARERLAVTLNSIGDGVIATDTGGLVTLLNGVAQELTGWPEREALGRPLEEIFRIVNEETRKRCPNPVERVLASGAIEGLGNHTMLIARDGSERILADSAAPISDKHGTIIGVVLVFRDITEVRRIERELRESEVRYRTLYDSSTDAIMLASPERGFLAGNRATLAMFGCGGEEEFISQSPAARSPEYQPDGTLSSVKAQQMMAIAMEKGSHFFEWTHKRMDGEEFFATVLLTRMELGGQKLLQATVRDITERARAEEALRESTQEFETVYNGIVDGVIIADITTLKIVRANISACAMFGYPESELLSKGIADLHPKQSLPCVMDHFNMQAKGKESVALNLPCIRKDGTVFYADIAAKAALYKGKPVLVGFFRDVSERKKAQEDLTRAAEEWVKTFDAISDFVFIVDRDHRFVKVNRTFADLLKSKPEDLIGKKCHEVLHGAKEPWYECPFDETRATGKSSTRVVDDPKIGVPLLVTTSPLLDEKGAFIGCVHLAKDITETRAYERKLEEALKVKSHFVSMVSHELRTPLASIKEGIGLVLDGIAGRVNEKQKEFLGIAKSSVERLARLVNAVLDFQKLDAGKIEFDIRDNNLNEVVREVYTTMLPAARERGLELATRLDETLSRIRFDRDSIVQVLTNIIDNAIKYTEKGSIIISTVLKGDIVDVLVQDTGSGIHQEDIPRLFHSFEQLAQGTDRKTGGTGLGLAISKQIIDAHRGKIWVESTPAMGSTFHFALPVKERRG